MIIYYCADYLSGTPCMCFAGLWVTG